MLGFAESKFLIVPQQFRGHDYPAMLDALRPRLPQLEKVYVVGAETTENDFDACLLSQPELDEQALEKQFNAQRPDPNDVTEIMFTSGTTGTPNGVMHTANTLICMAENLFNLNRRDVVLMGSPLAHHTGFMYAMVMSLDHGLKCVLMDAWQPDQAARLVAQERASLTLGATPFLSDVVDEAGNPAAAGEEGRVQSRCATSFVGYLKRPEDYGGDQDFWFETGDNARIDVDGYIRIRGVRRILLSAAVRASPWRKLKNYSIDIRPLKTLKWLVCRIRV